MRIRGLSDACVVFVWSLRDNCIFVYEMQNGGRCPSPATNTRVEFILVALVVLVIMQ